MTTRALVALGSNLGDRGAFVRDAAAHLRALGVLVGASSMYETEPIGGPEQDHYINAVVVLDTTLTARELLDGLLGIEQTMGRQRNERWDPRTIDLDLIAFGDDVIDEPGLTVPHPRFTERRFVLEPLLETFPDVVIPGHDDLRAELDSLSGQQVVRIVPLATPDTTTIPGMRTALWVGSAVAVVALGAATFLLR